LQPLLEDEAVTNIEINGCDRVWLSLDDGRVVAGPPVAESDAELVELIRSAAAYGGLSSRRTRGWRCAYLTARGCAR